MNSKNVFLLCVLAIFFLFAVVSCDSSQNANNNGEESEESSDSFQEEKTIDSSISDEGKSEVSEVNQFKEKYSDEITPVKESIDSILSKGDHFIIRPGYQKTEVGGTTFFVYGIRNTKDQPYEFTFEIAFSESTDTYGNSLGADETTLSWIEGSEYSQKSRTTFIEKITIQPSEFAVVPFFITIGEMMGENKETKEGTYRFRVIPHYYEEDGVMKDYLYSRSFSVRVE